MVVPTVMREGDTPRYKMSDIERQELYCHNCQGYVQFPIDKSMDGDYVLDCPCCKHKHYREVKNGVITHRRWGVDPSQLQTPLIHITSNVTWSDSSTWDSCTTDSMSASTNIDISMYNSWMNTTGTGHG